MFTELMSPSKYPLWERTNDNPASVTGAFQSPKIPSNCLR